MHCVDVVMFSFGMAPTYFNQIAYCDTLIFISVTGVYIQVHYRDLTYLSVILENYCVCTTPI